MALLGLLAAGCASIPDGAVTSAAPGPAAVAPRQAGDSYYIKAAGAVAGRIETRGLAKAKNVILFVGDGMGVSTITAARIFAGQQKGVDGESHVLAMEKLPWSAFSRTYTHDAQVADSAPTAAAMTTGVKSANGTIGVTQSADLLRCETAASDYAVSLWELAEQAGLSTGLVSTARLTHATPAAAYAKTTERDWEDDSQVSERGTQAGCRDIARQFVEHSWGDGIDFAMGGGRQHFLPETVADPEYPNRRGARKDGRNLVEEWRGARPGRTVMFERSAFDAADFAAGGQVLGLFEPSHMQYEADRVRDRGGEPSLAEMTRAAISSLSSNPNGYLLMVEAGRIDHAHHAGNAARALADTVALDEAVAAAVASTDPDDTLIMVTADHSHVFVIQGYPGRNNPILGLVSYPDGAGNARGLDGKPFTTLSYMNGPGSICKVSGEGIVCSRRDLSTIDTTAVDFVQDALIPLAAETHGGEDVAVFASGPGAQLVSGSIEQNEIFHIMGRSLGLIR
jgi:alkaline phosphatase